MLDQFKAHLERHFPHLFSAKILVACSGGIDSVLLAYFAKACRLNISLAHCNYHLRGEESDGDADFVRQLAKSLQVPLHSTGFNTLEIQRKQGGSIQMVARELRYEYFEELCQKNGYDFVLTGHHANDSLETFTINLSRGTGIDGLLGVPAINGKYNRPLLPFTRKELMAYARNHRIQWREDSSNKSNKYIRNRIRNKIVPELERLHPNFDQNFIQTLGYLKESATLLEAYANRLRKEYFMQGEYGTRIPISDLQNLQPLDAHLHLLFKPYGFTQWEDLLRMLQSTSGKEIYSTTHRLVKDREELLLLTLCTATENEFFIEKEMSQIVRPISLRFEEVDTIKEKNQNIAYLNKDLLKYPLVLRKWQNADYFYPIGMQGKKKLSKYFKDKKMSIIAKEQQWLLCSGEDIIWVVGHRLDHRYRVTADTTQIVKVILY
ncbi:tRNA lysidine(34) synthetase TilS [Flavobacterium sp. ASW18X]|uniref:tRNA lysidine(34) synthetase TilS n=1 Tax=Flavobacterium sp. ASW18X TaxID=2572595 RepID=UPI0010AE5C7A|nr:tRNA lysidine(34) synthetase TilS [Flavobacterium sp. ASW18X]TKD65927.1 tRNA lysidine(34) synthetase TilS [Flavobacterium sp. ASW18X]